MDEIKQKVGAIIVAAGSGQRMEGIDKVFALLGGKPVIARAVNVFEQCQSIDQIVLVLSKQNLEEGRQLATEQAWKKVNICAGGSRRQDSVSNGLNQLGPCQWVVIHDGARPLVTVELIEQGLEAAKETGAAVAAVPVSDTIKVAGEDLLVQGTPPRQHLWSVQTPQVFRPDIIAEAYRQAKVEVTDDATLAERLGYKVKLYTGSYDNIKITTPVDMAIAEILVQKYAK